LSDISIIFEGTCCSPTCFTQRCGTVFPFLPLPIVASTKLLPSPLLPLSPFFFLFLVSFSSDSVRLRLLEDLGDCLVSDFSFTVNFFSVLDSKLLFGSIFLFIGSDTIFVDFLTDFNMSSAFFVSVPLLFGGFPLVLFIAVCLGISFCLLSLVTEGIFKLWMVDLGLLGVIGTVVETSDVGRFTRDVGCLTGKGLDVVCRFSNFFFLFVIFRNLYCV